VRDIHSIKLSPSILFSAEVFKADFWLSGATHPYTWKNLKIIQKRFKKSIFLNQR
jgi:hypothetical protein